MKKITLLFAIIAVVVSASLFTSCEVEDISKPVITLTDGEDVDVILNSTWDDPGYTATDDEDGDLTNSVVVEGIVNTNLVGDYEVTYTVTDVAGNIGTATRNVSVYNEIKNWAGTYSAVDTEDGTLYGAETRTVNYSNTVNKRLNFIKFSGRTGADCYADVDMSLWTITMPVQNYVCGQDNLDREYEGNGNLNTSSSVISINYTMKEVGTSTPIICDTDYTRQ